jgi:hypothetical protein
VLAYVTSVFLAKSLKCHLVVELLATGNSGYPFPEVVGEPRQRQHVLPR